PPPPSSVNVALDPLPSMLFISTQLQQASLDNEKLVSDGTGFQKSILEDGPHMLRLATSPAGSITIEFQVSTGQAPTVQKVTSSDTFVVAVGSLLDHGQVYTSAKSLKVGLNGGEVQLLGESGLPVSLVPGANQVLLDDSKNPTTVALDVKANPTLTVF